MVYRGGLVPPTRRRIARRASGGVPKKPLKKERWLLVGCARVRVQALIVPSWGTRNGSCVCPLLTWKPVTLPTAWHGSSGQEGSGTVDVCPRITRVRGGLAASLWAARPTSRAREQARRPTTSQRAFRTPAVAKTADEDLDIDAAPLVACALP